MIDPTELRQFPLFEHLSEEQLRCLPLIEQAVEIRLEPGESRTPRFAGYGPALSCPVHPRARRGAGRLRRGDVIPPGVPWYESQRLPGPAGRQQ